MYKVYINNFMRNGSLITTEEQMFAVPSASGFPVQKPIVKASEDAAENFTFTMESCSPYYDSLLQHKTRICVIYDGPSGSDTDIIFDGKVLNISSSTVYHTKNVTCAGYYVFFNDSYYEGKQEKHRSKMTVAQYYTAIINNHNTMLPEKAVTQGTTGVTLPTDQDKYEPTAWTQTSGLLSNLTSNYGGHMLVQSSGNTHTLNWYKYYARDLGDGLRPQVTVGKNILDISADYTGDNVFTRVIPIGATNTNGKTIYIDGYNGYSGKAMPVTYIRNLYTDQELTDEFHSYTDYRDAETNFGVIYKTVTFSDADTQAKLWNYVKKWIKDSYFGIATSFTVKAIDLHITDGNYPKILIGECVDVTYLIVRNGTAVWETKKLVCKNISYDLFNPENNSYTFSIPSDLLDHSRTSKKSSKNQTASAGVSNKAIPKGDEDKTLTWHKVWEIIGSHYAAPGTAEYYYQGTDAANSFYANGELSGSIKCYDLNDIPSGGNPKNYPDKWFDARLIGKITVNGTSAPIWVGVAADRGAFAYTGLRTGNKVIHWYSETKGMIYQESAAGVYDSSQDNFEKIAQMIAQDTDSTYGGSTAATQFRNFGKISGSVKAYDPENTDSPSTHPEFVFQAEIVGKFGTTGSIKYVAISKEYGIFAYTHSAYPDQVKHWYMQVKGLTYDNISTLVTDDNGNVYATIDGSVDEKKSVWLKTRELTGYGSQGEVLVGIDTTAAGDQWRVKLNTPIQYTDESGVTRIADGFVSASDINLPSIPSFKTKFIVTDVLIAGKVDASEIAADIAYIRKINSQSFQADTYASAQTVHAKNINADNSITASQFVLDIESGSGSVTRTNLSNSFVGAMFKTSASLPGKIILDFTKADGSSTGDDINFNIADTQFYKDAVSAAWNGGGATAHFVCSTSSTTLDPGGSVDLYAYYIDDSSPAVPVRSYYSGTGRYSSRTISARNLRLRTPQAAVRPTTSNQTIVPGSDSGGVAYDGLAQVVVEGSTDLVQGNIKNGVTIFGVTGNYEPALEDKGTQYATNSTQTFTPSSGYYGISSLKIGAVTNSGNITAENIKKGVTIKVGDTQNAGRHVNVTGSYEPSLSLQTEIVYPSKSEQEAVPDPGYDGLSKVTVKPITISNTLTKENIKSGVRIVIGNSATDLVDITGEYQGGGGSYPTGNVHGSSEMWSPGTSTKYTSPYEIPSGTSLNVRPWILWDHGDGTSNWFYGDTFEFKAAQYNPYPTSKTLVCTGATFFQSEWIYTFRWKSSTSGLFTTDNSYVFHHNGSYS